MNTTMRYLGPAEHWTDALPIGNGRLGAMCFGGIELDRFQLTEATCWSGSPVTGRDPVPDEHDRVSRPLADLWIEQRQPNATPADYARQLDVGSAVASHAYRTGAGWIDQEAWISTPAQALVIRRRAQPVPEAPILIRLDSPHPAATLCKVPGGFDLVVRMPSDVPAVRSDSVRTDQVPGAAITAVVGLRVLSTGAMTVVDEQLRLDYADEVIIVVCVVTDHADPPFTALHGDLAALRRTLDDRVDLVAVALIAEGGYPALLAAHERDHA